MLTRSLLTTELGLTWSFALTEASLCRRARGLTIILGLTRIAALTATSLGLTSAIFVVTYRVPTWLRRTVQVLVRRR